MQDITDTWSVVVRPNISHASDGEGDELMPSLVVSEGVHALHGDNLLKKTLASTASGCIGMAPPSNSYVIMHMVFFGVDELQKNDA